MMDTREREDFPAKTTGRPLKLFSDLFKTKATQQLGKVSLSKHGDPVIELNNEDISKLREIFPHAIKASFNGALSPEDIGLSLKKRGFKGGFRITAISKSQVIINLNLRSEFIRLLSRNSWKTDGCTLNLSKWDPSIDERNDSPISLVWVTFKRLTFFLSEHSTLFSIASALGTPIQMDDTTARGGYFQTARILLELDVSKPKRSSILIRTSTWERTVELLYDLPLYCNCCKRKGHFCKPISKPAGKVLAGGTSNERLQSTKSHPKSSQDWIRVQSKKEGTSHKRTTNKEPTWVATCSILPNTEDSQPTTLPYTIVPTSLKPLVSSRSRSPSPYEAPSSNCLVGDMHFVQDAAPLSKHPCPPSTMVKVAVASNEHTSTIDSLALLSTVVENNSPGTPVCIHSDGEGERLLNKSPIAALEGKFTQFKENALSFMKGRGKKPLWLLLA
ncbi:unnamed protein product [Cuscuta campestris]|uniref:Uncharacterized protein n=1 Tax=Cuscuta campestris TaxID=132261 RepID=A0A484KZ85_9ASTE|nr:unnamed protein product [Cuscuta campestris]